jgi:hypothetical protein
MKGILQDVRRTYTIGLVVLTAALLVLACFLFALAQAARAPYRSVA